jgi:ankyrin repeat protein
MVNQGSRDDGRDDLNEFDCDGYRPIHHAILARDIGRAQTLINAGAMLNASTEAGDGALVLLCKALPDKEASEWLAPLLEWGAELIDRDKKGWSALHHAVARELLETVRGLMAAGADPFLKSLDGTRPIDICDRLQPRRDDIRALLKVG